MKAAYLCDQKHCIDLVYSKEKQEKLAKMFDFYDGIYTKADSDKLKDVECLFSSWGFPEYTEEEIKEYFPKLKVVFYGAGTVQYFARPFLNLGISVISAWCANSVPVVEAAVSQIVLANKGFFQSARMVKSPKDHATANEYFRAFPGNYGCRVGLIGLGAIGSEVAERLKAYRLEVCAYDPFASAEKAEKLGVKLIGLEELFETCQTISNHVANLPETVGMLNADLFNRMKSNATFINTGRGAQVVEADLIAALNAEPGRTAVLDVTFPEPPVEGSVLYDMPNVILTPHMAGSTGDECMRLGDYIFGEAERFLANEPFKYSVSLKMLETMA